jgi:glycine reductase
MGQEIAAELRAERVDGAILTSTSASSTRCGAAIAREIEWTAIPVVLITAVPEVAEMAGCGRIVRGQSITNVLGDHTLSLKEERRLRRRLVLRALEMLRTDVEEPPGFNIET